MLDYSHRYHAGNIGDVWKHVALVAVLDALIGQPRPVHVVDTHAGEGGYALGATGEHTAGIGRVRIAAPVGVAAVDRYVDRVNRLTAGDPRRYPGSPAIVVAALRPGDRATFCELQPDAAMALEKHARGHEIVAGDGYEALAAMTFAPDAELFVHIDPPFVAKPEWEQCVDAIAALRARIPAARCLLWYPVKSQTRPNAMLARLRATGVPATAIELVVTPVEIERRALAGSGLVLVDPPAGVLAALHAAASALGPIGSTHDGRWFLRTVSWGARG